MKTRILLAMSVLMALFAVAGMPGEASRSASGKTSTAIAAAQFPTGGCHSFSSEEVTCGNGPVSQGGCGVGSKTTVQFFLGSGRQQLQTKVVTCVGASGCPPETVDEAVDNPSCCDQDNDGYASLSCGGTDCRDDNANINPGRPEICGDGIDNNCDGISTTCICRPCTTDPGYSEFSSDWCGEGFHWSCTGCKCVRNSPIIIDVSGNGFALTDAANGVTFDFNGDGPEHISWTAEGADDAFLVLDRNGNDTIDDGTELFGNLTPQPASSEPHGFLALAEFDKPGKGGNRDGVIDGRDAIYSGLRLWQDANHNGISELNELHTLAELNVETLSLGYKESGRRDRWGNEFRYRAKVYASGHNHMGRWAYDVFLLNGN